LNQGGAAQLRHSVRDSFEGIQIDFSGASAGSILIRAKSSAGVPVHRVHAVRGWVRANEGSEGKVDSKGLSKPLTTPSRPWPRPLAELSSRQDSPATNPNTVMNAGLVRRNTNTSTKGQIQAQGSRKNRRRPYLRLRLRLQLRLRLRLQNPVPLNLKPKRKSLPTWRPVDL
jgi:hypothetical protein